MWSSPPCGGENSHPHVGKDTQVFFFTKCSQSVHDVFTKLSRSVHGVFTKFSRSFSRSFHEVFTAVFIAGLLGPAQAKIRAPRKQKTSLRGSARMPSLTPGWLVGADSGAQYCIPRYAAREQQERDSNWGRLATQGSTSARRCAAQQCNMKNSPWIALVHPRPQEQTRCSWIRGGMPISD